MKLKPKVAAAAVLAGSCVLFCITRITGFLSAATSDDQGGRGVYVALSVVLSVVIVVPIWLLLRSLPTREEASARRKDKKQPNASARERQVVPAKPRLHVRFLRRLFERIDRCLRPDLSALKAKQGADARALEEAERNMQSLRDNCEARVRVAEGKLSALRDEMKGELAARDRADADRKRTYAQKAEKLERQLREERGALAALQSKFDALKLSTLSTEAALDQSRRESAEASQRHEAEMRLAAERNGAELSLVRHELADALQQHASEIGTLQQAAAESIARVEGLTAAIDQLRAALREAETARMAAEDQSREAQTELQSLKERMQQQGLALRQALETGSAARNLEIALDSLEGFRGYLQSTDAKAAMACFIAHEGSAAKLNRLLTELINKLLDSEPGDSAFEELSAGLTEMCSFLAKAVEEHSAFGLLAKLGPDTRSEILDWLSPAAARSVISLYMSDPKPWEGIFVSQGIRDAYTTLPCPLQAALIQLQPSIREAAMLLLNSKVLLDAAKQLEVAFAEMKARLGDADGTPDLVLKRCVIKMALADSRPSAIKAARDQLNTFFFLNEGFAFSIVEYILGKNPGRSMTENQRAQIMEARRKHLHDVWKLVGYDPRNILLFLDVSPANRESLGLGTTHLGNIQNIAHFTDPAVKNGGLGCMREFLSYVGQSFSRPEPVLDDRLRQFQKFARLVLESLVSPKAVRG